ncbi:MAG: hypothetical protein ACIAQZ_01075 [Sedimentisphaeraceae bacterium JB056]
MKRLLTAILVMSGFCAAMVQVEDLNQLAKYAALSGNQIKMTAGVYRLCDYLTDEMVAARQAEAMAQAKEQGRKKGEAFMFEFSGSGNVFDLTGVVIEVDTRFLSAFKRCYIREFLISGNGNTIKGLTITDIGNEPTYMGGNSVSIQGDNNTLVNVTVNLRGSYPYGYGDLLGKGGNQVVSLKKHSGVQICGTNTKITGCRIFNRSFGHCFFIQGGINTIFTDCYVEGQMRPTDQMLAETSGPAFENGFASVYTNRDGENKIAPGYMKSLNECGYRTYASGGPENRPTGKVTLQNCIAKNVRVGFALHANEQTEPVSLENCEAVGCERGYYINKGRLAECRSDAIYGPMLYLEGNEPSVIEMCLTAVKSDYKVHALATIAGKDHKISFDQKAGIDTGKKLPIMVGYGMPVAGEISAIIPEAAAEGIVIANNTDMPVELGQMAQNCKVIEKEQKQEVERDFEVREGFTVIDSIDELREVVSQSGGKIRLAPGIYKVTQPAEDNKTVFFFTGSDNYFDLRGATIAIDTKVLADMRGRVHELSVYRILGDRLTFEGGVFENIGEHPPYQSLQDFSISGDNCTLLDCEFIVRGSAPYGYGDLLGKGAHSLTKLKKHSGVQIMGANTTLKRCKVINYAFGHCFFVQGGLNTVFEDCYAKGQMRSTDEMLSDTYGPAFDKGFASVYTNRKGEEKITAGYMKSLAEDGFRTYSRGGETQRPTGRITMVRCRAENTRAGFEISGPADGSGITTIMGCEAVGCERSYLLGENVKAADCTGDINYGPLLYLRGGENSDIEIELVGGRTQYTVDALATIAGKGHKVSIWQDKFLKGVDQTPIKFGYSMPSAANAFSPINTADASDITLKNYTNSPVEISEKANDSKILTKGAVVENQGRDIAVKRDMYLER